MEIEKKKKYFTPQQALKKAESYCAYQERAQQEVRDKLYEWGLKQTDVEETIAKLISSNFINEERFAKAYAGGKFRIKKWGKVKIRIELKKKNISEYCIKKGMAEIEFRDYTKTLKSILEKKSKEIPNRKSLIKNYKLAQYAISRGYESDLVWDIIKEMT